MLAPLLMVPAPCPLHLRPGGGALPALRPGEPPPPRAGPTATRRCGRQRGRGAARADRGEETRTPAAPGPEGQEQPQRSRASLLRRCAAASLRAKTGCHPPSPSTVRPPGRSGLSLSGTRVGHRASRGTAHTRCRPPRARSSTASTPRSSAPGSSSAPPAWPRPSRFPGEPHPLRST